MIDVQDSDDLGRVVNLAQDPVRTPPGAERSFEVTPQRLAYLVWICCEVAVHEPTTADTIRGVIAAMSRLTVAVKTIW